MTLNQMRYFCEVCRLQNITKASEILHVSQPTISIAIRDLESETNLNLFHRQGKKIIITQDGYKLFLKISNILGQMDDLDAEINFMANNRNKIRLAMPIQIGTMYLPRIFGDFGSKFPDITFDIVETGGIEALNLLENEKIDLAITNYQPKFRNKFVYHKLFVSECCFCTHKDNVLAKKSCLTFMELANEKFVMLDGSFFISKMIRDIFSDKNIAPNVIYCSPHLHSIKNLLKNRVASTFLLRQAIFPEDNLVAISMSEPIFIDSGIVTKKGTRLHPNALLLIKYLSEITRELLLRPV